MTTEKALSVIQSKPVTRKDKITFEEAWEILEPLLGTLAFIYRKSRPYIAVVIAGINAFLEEKKGKEIRKPAKRRR